MKQLVTLFIFPILILFSSCIKENSSQKAEIKIPVNNDEFISQFEVASQKIFPYLQISGSGSRSLSREERETITSAVEDLKAGLNYMDNHWQSHLLIGKAYQSLGDHRESLDWILRAVVINPENHILYKEASVQALYLRDEMKALYYSGEAMKRKESDPILMGNHAVNLLITGDNSGSLKLIDEALEIDPNDSFNQKIRAMIINVQNGSEKRPTCATIMP